MKLPTLKPLRGQALIQMLPSDDTSAGGIYIPEQARQEPATENSRAKTVKPRGHPVQGYIRAIGAWPQVRKGSRKGFQIMPEFKVGDRVIVSAHSGQKLARSYGADFQLVDQRAVLALVLEN